MPGTKIHGKEYPIQDIFCEKYFFKIPSYQRPYAWKVEHGQALLDDLLNALGNLDETSDDLDSYFLGSIVVVKDEDNPNAEVIDGQQRLTTLTILLAVIRALLEKPEEQAYLTPFIYNKGNPLTKTPDRCHIMLRERDAEFFQEYIQKDVKLERLQKLNLAELSDSRKNIVENALKYLNKISTFTGNQLKTLASYILTQTYLIVVSTLTQDSAYRIFSILNDRGLDLSYSDILKAELIGKIEDRQQEAYTKKWEDAEEQVGREGFNEVLAHIRTIHRKTKLKETILREIREYILPRYSQQDFIDKVIIPYTDSFETIKTNSYESERLAEDVNYILRWLCRIDNFDWMPPAMAFYCMHKHDSQELLRFFSELERLAASIMIRRENINYRVLRYGELLETIENKKDIYATNSPLYLNEEEKKLTIDRLNGDVYNSGARVYILRRLDAELSETKTTPELPIYTIEHVLPQHPLDNSQWIEWFPDAEEREALVHRIGNLALLSRRKNSQAQNFEFDKKKRLYFNTPLTPFALTTQIIKQKEWTTEVLRSQQEEYMRILKRLWRLE
jgi:hypothetical protein